MCACSRIGLSKNMILRIWVQPNHKTELSPLLSWELSPFLSPFFSFLFFFTSYYVSNTVLVLYTQYFPNHFTGEETKARTRWMPKTIHVASGKSDSKIAHSLHRPHSLPLNLFLTASLLRAWDMFYLPPFSPSSSQNKGINKVRLL